MPSSSLSSSSLFTSLLLSFSSDIRRRSFRGLPSPHECVGDGDVRSPHGGLLSHGFLKSVSVADTFWVSKRERNGERE